MQLPPGSGLAVHDEVGTAGPRRAWWWLSLSGPEALRPASQACPSGLRPVMVKPVMCVVTQHLKVLRGWGKGVGGLLKGSIEPPFLPVCPLTTPWPLSTSVPLGARGAWRLERRGFKVERVFGWQGTLRAGQECVDAQWCSQMMAVAGLLGHWQQGLRQGALSGGSVCWKTASALDMGLGLCPGPSWLLRAGPQEPASSLCGVAQVWTAGLGGVPDVASVPSVPDTVLPRSGRPCLCAVGAADGGG